MAWLAVDGLGIERIFAAKPHRIKDYQSWEIPYKDTYVLTDTIELPKGTIAKIIGMTLTWDDKPVEIK